MSVLHWVKRQARNLEYRKAQVSGHKSRKSNVQNEFQLAHGKEWSKKSPLRTKDSTDPT